MNKMLMLMLAFVFALSLSTAYAQMTTGSPSGRDTTRSQTTPLSKSDHDFLIKAAQGGMAEVEFGKLAASKATDEQVKEMGRKLVDDHTKANDRLMSIAQSKGVTLPTGLSKADQKELDKLSRVSGKDFDKAFLNQVKKDHEKDISLFKKEAKDGKDPDLRAFASQTLPALESHLTMAKDMSTGRSHSASSRQY